MTFTQLLMLNKKLNTKHYTLCFVLQYGKQTEWVKHLNSSLNQGKHRLNKDIQSVLLYWAELQLTILAHTLRLNSLVFPFQLFHTHSEKENKDKGLYKSKYKVFTFPAKPVV